MEPGSSIEHFPAIWQLIDEHITDGITDTTTYNYWSDVMSILVSHLFVILWSYFAMPQNPLIFMGNYGRQGFSHFFVVSDWAWRLGTMMLQFGRLGKLSCHKFWLYITVQIWTLEISIFSQEEIATSDRHQLVDVFSAAAKKTRRSAELIVSFAHCNSVLYRNLVAYTR